jgi:S-DNA-T family DNA segregation ATPase FtsK/SpoIIIE
MEEINKLNSILKSFKIKAECVKYTKIRNIALYDILLTPLTRVQHIEKYASEIALALRIKTTPVVKAIPEEGVVRLEVVEEAPHKISFFDKIDTLGVPSDMNVPMYLGSSIYGKEVFTDLSCHPHTLVGGATGSGKSVFLNVIMANALRLMNTDIFVIDTKRIEFEPYKSFGNVKVANDFAEAMDMIEYLNREMVCRYEMKSHQLDMQFNNIILIIDEMADIVLSDEEKVFSKALCVLAQKCRSAGIYIVAATQRPSVDIVSGAIKANLSSRIAFQTASHIDSKVILDTVGAEDLAGRGDCIIRNYNNDFLRLQVAYTTADEICNRYSNFTFNLTRQK